MRCFKLLVVNTLLLDRSNNSFNQSFFLWAMRRDEFLLQAIASDQSGVSAACKQQSVGAPQHKRHCLSDTLPSVP